MTWRNDTLLRREMRGKGLCWDCGVRCSTRICDRCREKRNAAQRRRYAEDRAYRESRKAAALVSYHSGRIRGTLPWVKRKLREGID